MQTLAPNIEISMQDILQRVTGELGHLAAMVDELQDSVTPVGDGLAALPHEKLQSLDYVSQHLKALEGFVAALGRDGVNSDALTDIGPALSDLTLAALGSRLAGLVEPSAANDACELF